MRAYLQYLRDRLRHSFWALPGFITLAALVLAPVSLALDASGIASGLVERVQVLDVRAEGARLILSTIAGSMMTVASLVFSMTLVALTLAAGNIGARLLDRYMGNRVNQVALGLFLATFVFSLLVLASVEAGDDPTVPQLSTAFSMLLAVTSFGWLIYFIHDLAASIQKDNVVAAVAADVKIEIRRLGTRALAEESEDEATAPDLQGRDPDLEIPAYRSGYLTTLDAKGLVEAAHDSDVLLKVLLRPGHFAIEDTAVAQVYGKVDEPDSLIDRIQGLMVLGPRRTPAQDVEFSLNLLVEIAARALSPGINDYFTALACSDHVTAALADVLRDGVPKGVHTDDDGEVRVLLVVPDFEDFADAALDPLRQCARDNLPVCIRLLENLRMLAKCATDRSAQRVILRHGKLIAGTALASAQADKDEQDVKQRLRDLETVFE